MTFDERRDRALALMVETPVPPMVYEPPLHRLLWRFGVEVPPPHFGGLWPKRLTMALVGIVFAHGVGEFLGVPWPVAAVGLALLFATSIGSRYARQAEALRLPTWDELDRVEVRRRPGSVLRLDPPRRAG